MIAMEEFITPEDIAKKIKKSEDTVTRWLRQGKLPGYKTGGTWIVSKAEFEDWLIGQSNLRKPKEDKK